MDDTLGDPLVVEVRDLFSELEILQQRGSAHAYSQTVLIAADPEPLIVRHEGRRIPAVSQKVLGLLLKDVTPAKPV